MIRKVDAVWSCRFGDERTRKSAIVMCPVHDTSAHSACTRMYGRVIRMEFNGYLSPDSGWVGVRELASIYVSGQERQFDVWIFMMTAPKPSPHTTHIMNLLQRSADTLSLIFHAAGKTTRECRTRVRVEKKTMNECNQWLAECVLSLWLNWNRRKSSTIEPERRRQHHRETTAVDIHVSVAPSVLTWCLP